jgi:hypothetical protein
VTDDAASSDPVPPELEGLDFEIDGPADITVSLLEDWVLRTRLDETVAELIQRGEALQPTTSTGRDLHSIRTALLVEMAKRGLR